MGMSPNDDYVAYGQAQDRLCKLETDRARLIEALREAVNAADGWAVDQGDARSILFYGFDTDKARLLLRELEEGK